MNGVVNRLRSVLGFRISNDRVDRTVSQYFCYGGAIGVMLCLGRAVHRFASTPFEIIITVLLISLLAMAMVILGLLLAPRR